MPALRRSILFNRPTVNRAMQRDELIGISRVIEGLLQPHHLCVRHVGIAITVGLDDERKTRKRAAQRSQGLVEKFHGVLRLMCAHPIEFF
jgi:hypothetical protein